MNRTLAAGLAAIVMLGVTACSEDEPRPRIAEPTESAPSPSDPSEETATTPEPVLRGAATRPTRAGAIAFTRYFWREANYAQTTGDTGRLTDLVSEQCDACAAAIDFVERATEGGGVIEGGEVALSSLEVEQFSEANPIGVSVAFDGTNSEQTVSRNGRVVDTYPASTVRSTFALVYVESGWRVDLWSFEN